MRPGPVMHPTPRDWLENLNREACGRLKIAALILGYADHSAVCHLFSRHGVKWRSYRDFEYRGVTATFRGHCIRLGGNYRNVAEYRRRFDLTPIEALDYYVARDSAEINKSGGV